MARRGFGGGVIALIVIDVILILVLIVLLVTHPRTPGEEVEPAEDNPTNATAETTPPPEESAETPDPSLSVPDNAADMASFAMPSRNIWCEIDEAETLCYIGHYTYTPEANEDCAGDLGSVVRLTSEGATFPCPEQDHGRAPEALPALDYEQDTVVGDFWCSSAESGVTCRSVDSGRGFTLAVSGFTPF